MNHLINRLRLEISCPDENMAFSLRQNFAQTYQMQIANVVDRVCTSLVPEEEWIQIEKIDIDLGRLSPLAFESMFSEVFLYKFEKELLQKLNVLPPNKRAESKQLSHVELFIYFLQNGMLPWWANEEDLQWESICLDLFHSKREILTHFFQTNQTRAIVWKRASMQFGPTIQQTLMSFFPILSKAKERILQWLHFIKQSDYRLTVSESHSVEAKVNNLILSNAPTFFFNESNAPLISWQLLTFHIQEFFLDSNLLTNNTLTDDPVKIKLTQILNKIRNDDPLLHHLSINEPTSFTASQLSDNISLDDSSDITVEEKLVVKHSGLVLLAPFLKSFFSVLGLYDDENWSSSNSLYKAVHLLKFLSTGLHQAPEYSLLLEKVFCGLPLNEPIPIAVELTELEIKEAEQLLNAVIEHWKVLKNTSIQGLRESFLKREGLLTKIENGWLLQVERKTLDVLLESIPWGYSTVHLPWNDTVIFVEW